MNWLPTTPWLPVTAPLTSGQHCRSTDLLELIVGQFDLARAERYQPRDVNGDGKLETFCNIAACDITLALGCPLPRVWLVGGAWREQRANDLHAWLNGPARSHGWLSISGAEAQSMADVGRVAVAVWLNEHGPGHIAVVVPSMNQPGIWIAQAGSTCFERGRIERGFGGHQPEFFGHH